MVERVENIVKGAAIATGTTSKIHYKGSYHEMLVNFTGSEAMQKNLEMIGPTKCTEDETAYAKKIQQETETEEKGIVCEIKGLVKPVKDPEGGSTDVAEVSWIAPTIHLSTTCAPFGVPWHSWAITASSRHSIGHKGMLLAAKVMATTAIDFLQDEPLLIETKKEFNEKLKGYTYKSGIPSGQKPPLRVKKIR